MHLRAPSSDPTRPSSASPLRRSRRAATALAAAATLVALSACSAPAAEPAAEATDAPTPHGYVAGASEGSEPQLRLATVDPEGRVDLLDLLDGESEGVAEIDPADSLSTDGRFVFASRASGTVDVVDTGVWTVDHGDHSHYYLAEPRTVGTVEASTSDAGEARVVSGADLTAVQFPATGERVVLDTEALGAGEIDERARWDDAPHDGVVVPLGEWLIVSTPGDTGDERAAAVRVVDPDGRPVDGAETACVDAAGTITTRVGVVVGCADGALLATADDAGTVSFDRIAYPETVTSSDRAVAFDGRRGRPTVAAVAGDRGVWLLDTRERTWSLIETPDPLIRVAAVDDAEGHVVGLDAAGRVVVLTADDGVLATTAALLPETAADEAALAGVTLTVDASRAYLNAPLEGAVFEIDYADEARVSRTFEHVGAPALLAETGR